MNQSESTMTDSWIGELLDGSPAGARAVWSRYYDRLIRLAHRRLSGSSQRMSNEEDVVVSAFKSFFRALDENRAPDLYSEDEIWRLLVTLTARKAIKVVRYEGRAMRDASLVDNDTQAIEDIIGVEPTPEFTMAVIDQFRELNERLTDDEMRTVAYRKMEGYSNAEIAQELNCSIRTVKRRLAIIRSLLVDEIDEQKNQSEQ